MASISAQVWKTKTYGWIRKIIFHLSGGATFWLYSFGNDSILKSMTAFWVCFEKSIFSWPWFHTFETLLHYFWMKKAKNFCNHSDWSFLATLFEYEQWLNQWKKTNKVNWDGSENLFIEKYYGKSAIEKNLPASF